MGSIDMNAVQNISRRSMSYVLLVVLLMACATVTEAKRRKEDDDQDTLDLPKVHFLVELIGRQLYSLVDNRKYKFYIYMTIGTLPSEESTIALLSTFCNVLYGCSILVGFLFVRREYMLLFTLLTLYVGPAIILIMIGIMVVSLAAFALYPVLSVVVIWLWFFVTSQLAQALGKYLGLDSDNDGDVDFLDLIHWASLKPWGKFLGFGKLYAMLDNLSRDPFQEINKKIDILMESLTDNTGPPQRRNKAE